MKPSFGNGQNRPLELKGEEKMMKRKWMSMMPLHRKVSLLFLYLFIIGGTETVCPGPTKEERALELTLNEKTDGLLRGTTAWLSSGLKIQESQ
jgi:hypothetical protein